MKASGIYAIRNLVNGKRYVGSAVYLTERFHDHRKLLRRGKHHSIKLQHAWNKYGEAGFVFEIIEIIEDKNSLLPREQHWLEFYESAQSGRGYNISPTAGSQLGVRRSQEMRLKLSTLNTGKKQSAETIAKRVAKTKGQKRTLEQRARMSAAKIGKKMSAEFRARMSELAKNRTFSALTRANMAAAQRGRKHSAETRAKMSAALVGNTRNLGRRRKSEKALGPALATT